MSWLVAGSCSQVMLNSVAMGSCSVVIICSTRMSTASLATEMKPSPQSSNASSMSCVSCDSDTVGSALAANADDDGDPADTPDTPAPPLRASEDTLCSARILSTQRSFSSSIFSRHSSHCSSAHTRQHTAGAHTETAHQPHSRQGQTAKPERVCVLLPGLLLTLLMTAQKYVSLFSIWLGPNSSLLSSSSTSPRKSSCWSW